MSGLVQYKTMDRKQWNRETRDILDRLAQTYIVEIETPCDSITDWYVQIRLSDAPVLAGYYGETPLEASRLVAASMQPRAAA